MQQCILSRLLQAENPMEDTCEQRTGLERTKATTWCWGQRIGGDGEGRRKRSDEDKCVIICS